MLHAVAQCLKRVQSQHQAWSLGLGALRSRMSRSGMSKERLFLREISFKIVREETVCTSPQISAMMHSSVRHIEKYRNFEARYGEVHQAREMRCQETL